MTFRTRGRFNVKRWGRMLGDRMRGTAFDRALAAAEREGRNEFVFAWNRGLGDVALGLVPLFEEIRLRIARSHITVFTRADLEDAFLLAGADTIRVVPGLERDTPLDPGAAAARMGIAIAGTATVFANPDPTRWLDGQRQDFPPVLQWDPAWDAKADALVPKFGSERVIGAHVHSETAQYYGYVKDWPDASWQELIARFPGAANVRWLLFGHAASARFAQANVVDLRGRTSFLDLMAVIRTRCRILVAPDSGVLTAAYYLKGSLPLDIVSLWSDPRQGVLKQDCPSPNPQLRHVPLIGPDEDVRKLGVDAVANAVAAALARSDLRNA
jgi:hypothetical protein